MFLHKNWDELPLVLSPAQVKKILQCGQNNIYTLFHRKDFPAVRVGRTFKISRDALRAWLDQNSAK
jgi:excisionase family DNA binding protein